MRAGISTEGRISVLELSSVTSGRAEDNREVHFSLPPLGGGRAGTPFPPPPRSGGGAGVGGQPPRRFFFFLAPFPRRPRAAFVSSCFLIRARFSSAVAFRGFFGGSKPRSKYSLAVSPNVRRAASSTSSTTRAASGWFFFRAATARFFAAAAAWASSIGLSAASMVAVIEPRASYFRRKKICFPPLSTPGKPALMRRRAVSTCFGLFLLIPMVTV